MSTTVGELRDLLNGLDPDLIIVMSKDGEGNGFSPLAEAYEAWYEADSTWSGNVIDADYLGVEEDAEDDEIQERLDAADKCVVLWPVN